jgi:DNA polymerase III sliding clamp (beta) subunit (PCNA family)
VTDRPERSRRGWRTLFARLIEGQRRDVKEILAENYAAEIRQARELAGHAAARSATVAGPVRFVVNERPSIQGGTDGYR